MAKRVLITGGAGFVGLHLAQHLSQADPATEITLVDDFSRGVHDEVLTATLEQPNVRALTLDLTDPAAYASLGVGYREVYHLAAVIGVQNVMERPAQVVRVNGLATLLLLDWLASGGAERLLFASTSEVYAWTQQFHELPIPTPEAVPLALTDLSLPRSSYAGSKIFGELAVTHMCQAAGRPFAIVRLHNVYGPRMGEAHVIPQIFRRVQAGESPLRVFNPTHRRAFCYVDDAVRCMHLAMERVPPLGAVYNVGNPDGEVTIGELAESILAFARRASDHDVAHEWVGQENSSDPITRRCPDVSRAARELGYKPAVGLAEGLSKTLTWYSRHDAAKK